MRFAILALFAGAVMAEGIQSTVSTTQTLTVTSCAASVSNCAASTKVYSNTTTPAGSIVPTYSPTGVLTTKAAACPTYSVKTISTSVTTVVPTVIYETVAIPCPTTASPSAGFPATPSNGTVTKPPVATVTAGAATLGNSLFVAAAAGLAAVVFV